MAPGRPDKWIRIPAATKTVASGQKRSLSEMERGGGDQPPPPPEEPADHTVVPSDRPLDPALLPEGDPDVEIESLIIPALEELHTVHIREASGANKNGDA